MLSYFFQVFIYLFVFVCFIFHTFRVESKGCTVLEASIGFAVVIDPRSNACISTVKHPAVVFERLSKEKVKIADGPLRLLETMDLDIYFRKVLTRKYIYSLEGMSNIFFFYLFPLSLCMGNINLRESICPEYSYKG